MNTQKLNNTFENNSWFKDKGLQDLKNYIEYMNIEIQHIKMCGLQKRYAIIIRLEWPRSLQFLRTTGTQRHFLLHAICQLHQHKLEYFDTIEMCCPEVFTEPSLGYGMFSKCFKSWRKTSFRCRILYNRIFYKTCFLTFCFVLFW